MIYRKQKKAGTFQESEVSTKEISFSVEFTLFNHIASLGIFLLRIAI